MSVPNVLIFVKVPYELPQNCKAYYGVGQCNTFTITA